MIRFPTEREAIKKYTTLSRPLRNTLDSRIIRDFIEKISRRYTDNETDIETIIQFSGLVFWGFLKPSDFADEIWPYLYLQDAETLDALVDELNKKVFISVKPDLERLYGIIPRPSATIPTAPTQTTEQTIKPEEHKPELKYKPEKHTVYEATSDKGQETSVPPAERVEVKPAEPAPFVIDLSEIPKPEQPAAKPAEPIRQAQGEPPLTTPFMLRKEEGPRPVAGSEKPRISIPVNVTQKKTEATPFRVELKEEEKKKAPLSLFSRTEQPKDRIVHYVGPKTSLFPGAIPAEKPTAPLPPISKIQYPEPQKPSEPSPPAEEVIDLSSFRKVQTQKQTSKQGPQIKGNVVDLR